MTVVRTPTPGEIATADALTASRSDETPRFVDVEVLFPEAKHREHRRQLIWLVVVLLLGGVSYVASNLNSGGNHLATSSGSSVTLAQFGALADDMSSGSFSAEYVFPATKGSTTGPATLYVAQRVPTGTKTPITMLGNQGEWVYRLTTENGAVFELSKNGGSVFDCWRVGPTKPLTCTGPGSLDHFGIGLTIAAQLYVPGNAYAEFRGTVIDGPIKPNLRTYRSDSKYGKLSCLRATEPDGMTYDWCLSATGRLVTETRPGSVGYPWTTIQLERWSNNVSSADFKLSGSPRGSFLVLPTMMLPPPAPPQR